MVGFSHCHTFSAQVEGVVATSIKAAEEATSATIPPEVIEKCMATAEVGMGPRSLVEVEYLPPKKPWNLYKWHDKTYISVLEIFVWGCRYWPFGFKS